MILVTRPIDDARAMAKLLEEKGFKCVIQPMLEIQYSQFKAGKYAAYITTSKHAKGFVPKNGKSISIPENGETAREVFEWIVKNLKPGFDEVIYLRGKDISFDMTLSLHGEGFDCDEAVVYEAKPVSEVKVDLSEVTLATFMSAQSLLNFVKVD